MVTLEERELLDLELDPDNPDWETLARQLLGQRAASRKFYLAMPGVTFMFGCVKACVESSQLHQARLVNTNSGWAGFNAAWVDALNAYELGEITHFAMVHADMSVTPWWVDTCMEEMDKYDLGLVSVPARLKDGRAICSCGVGKPGSNWTAHRRWTVPEIQGAPKETFNAADMGYPGYALLHNNGCWVADLRKPEWFKTDDNGDLYAFHNFPRRVRRGDNGMWDVDGESEDWFFSRRIHELGIKSAITRKVRTIHAGVCGYPSYGDGGANDRDEDCRDRWGNDPAANFPPLVRIPFSDF